MSDQRYQAEALDRFLDELIENPEVPAPIDGALDPETAAWTRRIVAAEQSATASPDEEQAQARVWERVVGADLSPSPAPFRSGEQLAGAANLSPSPSPARSGEQLFSAGRGKFLAEEPQSSIGRFFTSLRMTIGGLPWLRVGLAAAGIVIVVAVSLYVWASQPPAVSAQEIVQRAQATLNSPAAGGVQSFVLTKTWRFSAPSQRQADGEEAILDEKFWYEAPNRWRREMQRTSTAPDGKQSRTLAIWVSDGTDMWDYDSTNNSININRLDSSMTGKGQAFFFGREAETLAGLFQQASTCFDPKVIGSTSVVGRATYIVDLGPDKCPPASVSSFGGRVIIWVDKDTFFVLRVEQRNPVDDKVVTSSEATLIQYNAPIDPAEFTFTPPPGAKVYDNRPKPAPSGDQFQQQLQQLAKQVDFPVLVPSYLPQGLAPQQPKIDTAMDTVVNLSYFPTSEPDKDSLASLQKGLTIEEQRATNSLVARWTENADPITIGSNKGWLRRGVRNADGTGSNSSALVLRDGVLISVSSFTITPEELIKVAASLQAVPGGHAPLPNPTPLSLAELRRRVAFPIFVPTFVPAGLTPEPPISGEGSNETVHINYHAADGAVALTVLGGPAGCCLDADGRKNGEAVKLPGGIAAHFLNIEPRYGGPILWWVQDGAYVALSGSELTKEVLVKVAASMSKTADLGKIEPAPARPTPTTSPLKYKVLRPSWLPESMTVREQRDGDITMLGFDPRPDDGPHGVLTLQEIPKAMVSPGGSPDPQETHAQMGGHDVTIIKRGQNCITLTWDMGDLQLTLTNPYDPPGQPRYSCDQLQKVVESIK